MKENKKQLKLQSVKCEYDWCNLLYKKELADIEVKLWNEGQKCPDLLLADNQQQGFLNSLTWADCG